ncbi:DUF6792 domain-containing protein [Metabacillus litoralis]|uniref:DUF6792 domain-containing protein n=1 Tax=Metabacillus litoralis TaxID=152268 RepID=UPI00204031BA|nr:DUF6792 domain-containing protein [Metabacillus litoralis]MCM3409526.1 flagellar protein FlgN [Metabacillus litoralis]
MNNRELINTDILRARIMQLEYENLNELEMAYEIKRIFFEETGEKFPAEIKIYRSDDILNKVRSSGKHDSGFDGTTIHFYSEKNKLNQSITVTRGSESKEKDTWKPLDWTYNLNGIFIGLTDGQYRDAEYFDNLVTQKINDEHQELPKLIKYGYGHSLGGNNISILQIMSEDYTNMKYNQVYVINDAPPTAYQLSNIDEQFYNELKINFDFTNYEDIYTIPPDELKAFTEEYYKNKIDETTIHHLTAEEDMLYGASSVRGFLEIGGRNGFLDTDPIFSGIRELVDKIPDKDLRTIQMFLSNYSTTYNNDGFDGFIKELTGFNPAVVDSVLNARSEFSETVEKVQKSMNDLGKPFTDITEADNFWSVVKESVTLPFDVVGANINFQNEVLHGLFQTIGNITELIVKAVPMIIEMTKKLPEVISSVKVLYENLDPILQAFVDVGFISQVEKDEIVSYIKEIETSLVAIQTTIDESLDPSLLLALNSKDPKSQIEEIIEIVTAFRKIRSEISDIQEAFEGLKNVDTSFMEHFSVSAHAHGLDAVINALAVNKNISYKNNDMYMSPSGNGEIKVNISSSVRIYQKGLAITEEKESNVKKLKALFDIEYLEDYQNRQREIVTKIHTMESNPSQYSYLLYRTLWNPAGGYYTLTTINVNEQLFPFPSKINESFSHMIETIEGEIEKEKVLVKKIRDSIEELFSEEEKIAKMFDYQYGG